jgi:hypothetical protein
MSKQPLDPYQQLTRLLLAGLLLIAAGILLLLFSGCSTTTLDVSWNDVYPTLDLQQQMPTSRPAAELVTLHCAAAPLVDVMTWLAQQTRGQFVIAETLDDRKLTIDVVDEPLDSVMQLISRRLNTEAVLIGRTWWTGSIRPEDRSILTHKARMSQGDLSNVLPLLTSSSGKTTILPDGLVIVADRPEVLERVSRLLTEIESSSRTIWFLQLHLVSITRSSTLDLGFDLNPEAAMAVTFAGGKLTVSGGATLASLLRATRTAQGADLIGKPLLCIAEGSTVVLTSGVTIPVPNKVVSDQGTVSTQSYDRVNAGLSLTAKITAGRADTADLELKLDQNEVTGYVGEAPVTTGFSYTTSASMAAGQTYLLGCVARQSSSLFDRGPVPSSSVKRDNQTSTVQVWAKAYRVGAL